MTQLTADHFKRCLRADKDAVAQISDELHERLFPLAYQMTGDAELAEDATQEMFFAVFEAMKKHDPREEPLLWCYRMAVKALLEYLGQWKHGAAALDTRALGEEPQPPAGKALPIVEQLAEDDKTTLLLHALGNLDLERRACVCLRMLHHWNYASIARILDTDAQAVRHEINIGIALLALQLRQSEAELKARMDAQNTRDTGDSAAGETP